MMALIDSFMSWFLYFYAACAVLGIAIIIRKTIRDGVEGDNW